MHITVAAATSTAINIIAKCTRVHIGVCTHIHWVQYYTQTSVSPLRYPLPRNMPESTLPTSAHGRVLYYY